MVEEKEPLIQPLEVKHVTQDEVKQLAEHYYPVPPTVKEALDQEEVNFKIDEEWLIQIPKIVKALNFGNRC